MIVSLGPISILHYIYTHSHHIHIIFCVLLFKHRRFDGDTLKLNVYRSECNSTKNGRKKFISNTRVRERVSVCVRVHRHWRRSRQKESEKKHVEKGSFFRKDRRQMKPLNK